MDFPDNDGDYFNSVGDERACTTATLKSTLAPAPLLDEIDSIEEFSDSDRSAAEDDTLFRLSNTPPRPACISQWSSTVFQPKPQLFHRLSKLLSSGPVSDTSVSVTIQSITKVARLLLLDCGETIVLLNADNSTVLCPGQCIQVVGTTASCGTLLGHSYTSVSKCPKAIPTTWSAYTPSHEAIICHCTVLLLRFDIRVALLKDTVTGHVYITTLPPAHLHTIQEWYSFISGAYNHGRIEICMDDMTPSTSTHPILSIQEAIQFISSGASYCELSHLHNVRLISSDMMRSQSNTVHGVIDGIGVTGEYISVNGKVLRVTDMSHRRTLLLYFTRGDLINIVSIDSQTIGKLSSLYKLVPEGPPFIQFKLLNHKTHPLLQLDCQQEDPLLSELLELSGTVSTIEDTYPCYYYCQCNRLCISVIQSGYPCSYCDSSSGCISTRAVLCTITLLPSGVSITGIWEALHPQAKVTVPVLAIEQGSYYTTV